MIYRFHMTDIEYKLLNDIYNRAVFESDRNSFLVGGFIRDLIISGKKVPDRDYVVSSPPEEAALRVQKRLGGTLVSFRHGNMARLVFLTGITMDFTRLRGTIQRNLLSRDFTINSIAFCEKYGIMDPARGVDDVKRRVIRTTRKKNIQDDPLRCLRAYRFQSELGWRIDSWTRGVILEEAHALRRVARERITSDFFRLLRGNFFGRALRGCARDGVLDKLIIMRDNNEIQYNIKKMVDDMRFASNIPDKMRGDLVGLTSQGMRNIDVIKLERLTRGWNLEKSLLRLSSSNEARLRVAHEFIQWFRAIKRCRIDKGVLFEFFSSGPEMLSDFVVLSGCQEMISLARRFRRIAARRLVPAEEIMLKHRIEGEALGKVLRGIDRERFAGNIRSGQEARAALGRLARKGII